MAGQSSNGKKGNKRSLHGRKKRQCAAYKASSRRERNKAARLLRHLHRQPTDSAARECLNALCDANLVAMRVVNLARKGVQATA